MSAARALLRNAFSYSVGSSLSMLASIARVAVTAKLLSPSEVGTWLGLQLLLGYGANLHLGTLFGLFRSVPMLRAASRDGEAEAEKQTAFTFITIVALFGFVPFMFASAYVSVGSTSTQRWLVAALLSLTLVKSYFVTLFKAESRFVFLSRSAALGALVAVLGLALIARFGLSGLLAGMIAQSLLETAYLAAGSEFPHLRVQPSILLSQMRIGIMTMLVSLGTLSLTSIDRMVMLRTFGERATSPYYIGANIILLMPVLAGIPAAVLTPKFFERVGRGEDLEPLVDTPTKLAGGAFALVLGGGAVALPWLVQLFWPHLRSGVPAAQGALIGTLPLVLAGLVTNVFYALNRQGLHALILAGSCLLSAFLASVLARALGRIEGAVVGGAAGMYIYYIASYGGAGFLFGKGFINGVWRAAQSLAPIAWVLVVVVLIESFARDRLRGLTGVALGEIVFLVLTAPLSIWLARSLRSRLAHKGA